MSDKLDALKAAFGKPDTQQNESFVENYPFWQMNDGEQAIIRFVPDTDDDNPLAFLVEKMMHRLVINGQKRSVPCLKMYGESECPICALSSEFYSEAKTAKDNGNAVLEQEKRTLGKKYWRNKQHIARALIVEDPLKPEDGQESHQGKIRTITISYQIYEAINQAFQSGDLDDVPYDLENGCDFIIKKKVVKDGNGEYASYVYSTFSRRSTPISKYIDESEIELTELSSYLPTNPGKEKIEELLEADITGASVQSTSPTTSKPTESMSDKLAELKSKTSTDDSKSVATDDEVEDEAAAILASIMNDRS